MDTTAALLPDGRVIFAGSDRAALSHTAGIYRPRTSTAAPGKITSAPTKARYGGSITVSTDAAVTSLVLMRSRILTHQVDTEQRSVSLSFRSAAPGEYVASCRRDSDEAPPGDYMLFAVTSERRAVKGTWVRLLTCPDRAFTRRSTDVGSPELRVPRAAWGRMGRRISSVS